MNTFILLLIGYIVMIFITFAIFDYFDIHGKGSFNHDKIGMAFFSIIWVLVLIAYIILTPFYIIDWVLRKTKKKDDL